MSEASVFILLVGAAGGLLPDILRIIAAGRDGRTPAFLKAPIFWISLTLLMGIGALAAWLGGASSAKEAIAYGFGGPEVISRLGGRFGQTDRAGTTPTLFDWWSY